MAENQLKRRLKMLLEVKHITAAEFSRRNGLSSGYVNCVKDSISFDVMRKLVAMIPDANLSWLITGEPPMLSSALSDIEKANRTIEQLSKENAMLQKIIDLYERNENGKKTDTK